MERILLGFDGSDGASSALEWVADRSLRGDSIVEVVIVTNPLLQDRPLAEEQLAQAEQRLHSRIPSLPVETERVDGLMPSALTDAATGVDILVIGVDSDRPVREALHGWMALRVSAKATVPTCIVPAGWSVVDGPVSVGLSQEPHNDSAAVFAATEALARGESLRVVHAWVEPPTSAGTTAVDVSRRATFRRHSEVVERAVERLRTDFPTLTIEPVLIRDNAVAALAAAASDSSLLVIGTHGRGVLAGGFYGSVGQDLIGAVRTPVVVVPPSA